MKTRSRRFNAAEDDRDTESDECFFTDATLKRKKIPNSIAEHLRKYKRHGLRSLSNHLSHNIKQELEDSRDASSKSPMATISSHSNSNEVYVNGGENDEKQSIRRSTRQRKFMYDNLNQTWLLATSIPDFSKLDSLFPAEHRGTREGNERPNRSEVNHSYELRRLGLSTDSLDFEDMYSRVKRKKRKAVHTFYSRRISQDGGSMADTEDTDHNGMSDSDTIDDRSDLEGVVDIPVDASQEDSVVHGPKYSLRPKKPITERFQFPIEPVRPKRSATTSIFEPTRHHQRPSERETLKSTAHRSQFYRRKKHAIHSSTSSSSDDERRFEKRKAISMARARNRCLPLNFIEDDLMKGVLRDRVKIGSSLADIDPMSIDKTVSFENVGGLDKHIQSLKEMVLFPLMYPEVFQRFKITPPRGVLFYGPPGTGKTLVARALSNECSTGDKRVAFFMRKGADCLSKWVGESERQLRLLFDQAYSMRPSIIFFDEIDGLAPVRSTRQDQIHSSIVSTLLALMDGLDNRGEIVIIGATNRLDAIDPALRRPGRFDRELLFPLPSLEPREHILQIIMKEWNPPQPNALISELATLTAGYCGADLRALCSEAALVALRRRYPQIYQSKQKLQLDVETIQVKPVDFMNALKKMKPSVQRSAIFSAKPLSVVLKPLLEPILLTVVSTISRIFPFFSSGGKKANGASCKSFESVNSVVEDVSEDSDCYISHEMSKQSASDDVFLKDGLTLANCKPHFTSKLLPVVHRPYFLLSGVEGQGQGCVAPAVLYLFDNVSIHRLDIPALYAVTSRAPEEACAQIFHEAQRNLPSVIFLPHIGYWWETLSETVRATFLSLLQDLDPSMPLMLFATSDVTFNELPLKIQELFGVSANQVFLMQNPKEADRRKFFANLLKEIHRFPKKNKKAVVEELPVAPPPVNRQLTEEELNKLRQKEEATLRELRLFLRDILTKLARDRRFSVFSRPVDPLEVPDYQEVIKNPMDLETMMTKIDLHQYETVAQFLSDIDLVCQNALEYNPDRDPSDKLIRHRACALKDMAHALVLTELDDEFEKICQDIQTARKERGESPAKFVPKRYHMLQKVTTPNAGAQVTPSNDTQQNNTATNEPNNKQCDKKENDASQLSPTRFSNRLRGLGVPSMSNNTENTTHTVPRRAARYTIWRKRKSPWFGGCRRKLIRRTIAGVGKEARANKRLKPNNTTKFPEAADTLLAIKKETKANQEITFNHAVNSIPEKRDDKRDLSGSDSSATVVSPNGPASPTELNVLLGKDQNTPMDGPMSCNEEGNSNETAVHSTSPSKNNNNNTACDISMDFNCSNDVSSLESPTTALHNSPIKQNTAKISESEVQNSSHVSSSSSLCPEDAIVERVIIDTSSLCNFLEIVVKATENYTVEKLLKLYAALQQCIYKHRREINKEVLLMELKETLDGILNYQPS